MPEVAGTFVKPALELTSELPQQRKPTGTTALCPRRPADDHSGATNKLPSMALTTDSDMQEIAAALEVALPAACAWR